MTRRGARKRARVAGFTLIEALVATALMGVVLASLASLTGQWLPNWNRGISRAQSSELIGLALDRLVGDIAASEFVTPSRDATAPLFDGAPFGVVFVRSALGPNARPGLEIVRIAEFKDANGAALVRSMAPFTPLAMKGIAPILPPFADPIALLRSPYRVSFSYAGPDGEWKNTWQNAPTLPTVVRMTVRADGSDRPLSVSTAALIHVDLSASCVAGSGQGGKPGQPQPGQAQPGQQVQPDVGQQPLGQQGLGQPGQQAQQARGNIDCSKAVAAAGAPDQADGDPPPGRTPRRDM
jgi:general secretion pathway protein J